MRKPDDWRQANENDAKNFMLFLLVFYFSFYCFSNIFTLMQRVVPSACSCVQTAVELWNIVPKTNIKRDALSIGI